MIKKVSYFSAVITIIITGFIFLTGCDMIGPSGSTTTTIRGTTTSSSSTSISTSVPTSTSTSISTSSTLPSGYSSYLSNISAEVKAKCQSILTVGALKGRKTNVFAKIGDSLTGSLYRFMFFVSAYNQQYLNLDAYSNQQPIINYFSSEVVTLDETEEVADISGTGSPEIINVEAEYEGLDLSVTNIPGSTETFSHLTKRNSFTRISRAAHRSWKLVQIIGCQNRWPDAGVTPVPIPSPDYSVSPLKDEINAINPGIAFILLGANDLNAAIFGNEETVSKASLPPSIQSDNALLGDFFFNPADNDLIPKLKKDAMVSLASAEISDISLRSDFIGVIQSSPDPGWVNYTHYMQVLIDFCTVEGVVPVLFTLPPIIPFNAAAPSPPNTTDPYYISYTREVQIWGIKLKELASLNKIPYIDYYEAVKPYNLFSGFDMYDKKIYNDGHTKSYLDGAEDPSINSAVFTPQALQYTNNARDLITLMMLDKFKRIVIDNGAPE